MGTAFGCAALALTITALVLLIRERNGTGAFALAVCGCTVLMRLLWQDLQALLQWWQELADRFAGQALLPPLLRCAVIALAVRITAELCRDSGQRAIAVQVELAGAVCGMIALLPLLQQVMELMGP